MAAEAAVEDEEWSEGESVVKVESVLEAEVADETEDEDGFFWGDWVFILGQGFNYSGSWDTLGWKYGFPGEIVFWGTGWYYGRIVGLH